ncbi:hypothetical protein [Bifidobacterium castoris]|uniref:Uncharacterized protein n=1 Tax=Bifidobacterium castoris TaxID=2306972 RepID=A0A430F7Y7_9BIFI|nr:hypothetical protein [Bifidobacterium castoris]RSX48911.1 hypothetical protein D2E22_1049 [Bifidobacterium castoris]
MSRSTIVSRVLRVAATLAGGILLGMSIAAPDYLSTPWPQGLITLTLVAGIAAATVGIIATLFDDYEPEEERRPCKR